MRQVLVPVLAVAAIVGIILWLEARGSAGVSPQSGVGYGPVDLPAALSALSYPSGPTPAIWHRTSSWKGWMAETCNSASCAGNLSSSTSGRRGVIPAGKRCQIS